MLRVIEVTDSATKSYHFTDHFKYDLGHLYVKPPFPLALLAMTIRSTKEYSDYAMGAWAANRDAGIRNYIYSLVRPVSLKSCLPCSSQNGMAGRVR